MDQFSSLIPPQRELQVKTALGPVVDFVRSLNSGAALPESDQTDWTCKPTKEHPNPIIMLHGIFAPGFTTIRTSRQGIPSFYLKYGMIPGFDTIGGVTDIRNAAKELDVFITKVLAASSAQKIDLIGHSAGSVVARWYLKSLYHHLHNNTQDNQQDKKDTEDTDDTEGKKDKADEDTRLSRVHSVVSIAPVGKGTSMQGMLALSQVLGLYNYLADTVQPYCEACVQLLEGSDFMQDLYGEDGLQAEVPGVRYLNIVTSRDDAVTPFTNGVMTIPEPKSKPESSPKPNNNDEAGVEHAVLDVQNLVIENHCDFNPEKSRYSALFTNPFAFHATDTLLSSDSNTLDTISCIFDSPTTPTSS
ncbi:hypothetical protein BGX23_005609 [Mortierella sp. AD031]|nr:hypothetical protein BGX23_005609 [Mortierella sp. AD031]